MLSDDARGKKVPFMKSENFEFLRTRHTVLAYLADFAERYAHEDLASSFIKQRSFVEHTVTIIYEIYRLRPPCSDNLNDLMNETAFLQAVPEIVENKLHTVRKAGNHAAHPRRPITSQLSLECLAQLFDIARWFWVQLDGGTLEATPKYTPPPSEPMSVAKKKGSLEKLLLAEAIRSMRGRAEQANDDADVLFSGLVAHSFSGGRVA